MTENTAGRPPGVLVQLVDPPPPIRPVLVDVPAFVCVCERGPLHRPTRIGSWAEFLVRFGGFLANGLGAYTVKAFFEQGGRACWVVRVAAAEAHAVPTGGQPADRLASVLAPVDGFAPGAAATVRQGPAAHLYLVRAVDPTTGRVTWDRPLHPDLDLTQPFDVYTGAGSASVTLPASAGGDALRLTAAAPGSWGNRVGIVVAPGRRAATANRPEEPSNGTATPVRSTEGFVAGAEVLVSQEVAGVVTAVTAVVARVDSARRVLWWATPLPGSLQPALPMRLETSSLTLSVRERGQVLEVWPDLSMVASHPRHVATVLAASTRIGPVEVLSTGPVPAPPAFGTYPLAGGRDGTAALRTTDLLGDELLGDRRGVAALADLDEPAAVAVPDLVGGPTPLRVELPPTDTSDPCAPCPPEPGPPPALEAIVVEAGASFGAEEIRLAQQELVASCERNSERIALLDPPCGDAPLAVPELREWAARFSSRDAVATVPWLRVVDPLAPAAGPLRRVPPSGHLAGVIAQVDALGGPWLSAANRSLTWAHGLDLMLTEAQQALLNESGVNVIRAVPGRGLVPMGARTLSADPLWLFAAVRRAMILLRRTLRQALAWAVFEPNGVALNRLVVASIDTLLLGIWQDGGLAGADSREAFYVVADQSAALAGELRVEVGVALTRPAEFFTVRVSRLENRLELSEAPERVEVVS
jgi:hypothetical protein